MVEDVSARGRFDSLALLKAIERAAPADAVDVLAARLRADLGALATAFLIADFSSGILARFSQPGHGETVMEQVAVHGTRQGDVLRDQRPAMDRHDDQVVVVAPVTARGEAIGVIEVFFPGTVSGAVSERAGSAAGGAAERLMSEVSDAAHLFAYAIVLNRSYTDLFEWGRRSVPLDVAAEIQHRLLPDSFTCESAQATIAGWMAPGASIAGDTFDYAFGRTDLYLSLTDAMGHGLAAAQLATLLVNGLRNSRRDPAHKDLAETAATANSLMSEHSDLEQFVTGLLLHIELPTGMLSAVNAGHLPFYLMRATTIEQIAWPPDAAFGMFPDSSYAVHHLQLHPGDRVLLVTDGMVDRNAAGIDLATELATTRRLHPRELVQHMTQLVLETCDGHLQDDATVMCLDWHHPSGPERHVASSAKHERVSGPDR